MALIKIGKTKIKANGTAFLVSNIKPEIISTKPIRGKINFALLIAPIKALAESLISG